MNSLFSLVSTLLTEMLKVGDEKLIVTVKSESSIYDSGRTIEIRDPFTFLIHLVDLKERGGRTEISMTGAMCGQDSKKHPCSFYFIMKRNIHVILRKSSCIEEGDGKCMILSVRTSPDNLHDTLFHLVLEGVNSGGEQYDLGEGEGFLLFER